MMISGTDADGVKFERYEMVDEFIDRLTRPADDFLSGRFFFCGRPRFDATPTSVRSPREALRAPRRGPLVAGILVRSPHLMP